MRRMAVLLVLLVGSPLALATTIDIPGDYPTIQEGVDAAQPGDTVYVHAGTYYESIRLGNANLIGEDPKSTIIIGVPSVTWSAIRLVGSGITVSGFTLKADGRGIWLEGSNCTITGNIITGCPWGIDIGHHLETSPIGDMSAGNEDSVQGAAGVSDGRSSIGGNVISENRITNNAYGIYFSGYGFRVTNNTVESNTIVGNSIGILLEQLIDSNLIVENTIALNGTGISSESVPAGNVFYHNDFLRNTVNAYDEGSNIYYSDSLESGNFWSDYSGDDGDGNGIGDEPYFIAGGDNSDDYPLMIKFTDPCGDVSLDGLIDIDDVVELIWLIWWPGGKGVYCYMDADGSGNVDIDDVVYLIAYVFSQGPSPAEDCCTPIW